MILDVKRKLWAIFFLCCAKEVRALIILDIESVLFVLKNCERGEIAKMIWSKS